MEAIMAHPQAAVLKKRDKADPPRGVLKGDAPSRPFRHERYHPSPDLAPYVEHFWTVEWDLRGQPPYRAETLPHPSVHMIFEPRGSRIRGPATAKFSRLLRGKGGVFAVKFTPAGFHPFARVPVSKFTDSVVALRTVFGANALALDRAVRAERAEAARIEIVEAFLRRRLREPDADVQRVSGIVYQTAGDRTLVKVDDLVKRFATNKRTLQRLFIKYVGVSPKWVIQRYRLHEAAARLAGGPVDHAALAAELGYSDQAHFARDFKVIVGMPPAAYARAARA
jgi:AraC-like DNA-binding protein